MSRAARRTPTTVADPTRLLLSETAGAALLKDYVRRTRPGRREGMAAWYRLRPHLDAGPGADTASFPRRWTRARLLSGALTAALLLLVLARANPRERTGEGEPGPGGAAGAVAPGAGGTEGSSGASAVGETAAADGRLVCPLYAG